MRRAILLGLVVCCALPRDVRAQVIPGIGMTRADSRAEATAYRGRVHDELTAVLAEWSRCAEQRDSVGLSQLYTEAARSRATGVEDAAGPGGILVQLRALKVEGAQVYFTVDDFDTSGDFGYLASSLTLQPTGQGGPASTTEARAVFVMLRDFRGRWHIRHQSIALSPRLDSSAKPGHP
ncbi:MAG TPA: hypothetical protein VFI52_10320 [Gemmatimonadaceae bacterium]|nr:hypothetical protein [Gemmatimonadaceae bacterium]